MLENLILSAEVMLPLLLMMLLGYLLKCLHLFSEVTLREMNRITFKVFLPLTLLMNIYRTDLRDVFQPKILIYAAAAILGLFLLLLVLIPLIEKDNRRRGVLIQGIMRSNFVIFAIPVTASLCGQENIGIASLMVAVVVPMFNVLSVVALEVFRGGKIQPLQILKGIVTNPLIIASAIGLALLGCGVRMPSFLEKTLSDLGGIATPLILVVLGASFSFSDIRGRVRPILIGVLGRTVAVPLICTTLAALLGFRGVELVVLLAMFGAPTAVSSFTMAQQMGGDGELAGQLVVLTSLVSVLTMFLAIFICKSLLLF